MHPAVGDGITRRVDSLASTDTIVVLDIPLLTENPRGGLQGKIVVDVPPEVQVDRLVRYRGFTEDEARARIARQASREDRLHGADFVIENSGTVDELDQQVDELWQWLKSLPQLPDDFSFSRRSAVTRAMCSLASSAKRSSSVHSPRTNTELGDRPS